MTQHEEQFLRQDEQIGVYAIKDVIGTDRSCITYRAWNQHLNAAVAITEYFPRDFAIRHQDGKTIEPKSVNSQETYNYGLKAFLQQSEALTEIQHPNVVSVHNLLQFNGTAYLVMDYENGTPLSELHQAPASFTEAELQAILQSLLNALQELHEQSIVHADIHPGNILIRKNGDPVLIDFAAARLALAAHTNSLQKRLHRGYAPAEQYTPDNPAGPVTDIYALGATMYQCITQSPPCSALERITALNNNELDPLQPIVELAGTGFSTNFLNIIDNMLRPQAKDRPQSAHEVLTKLAGILQQTESAEKHKTFDHKGNSPDALTTQTYARRIISGVFGTIALISALFWYIQHNRQIPKTVTTEIKKSTAATSQEQNVTERPDVNSMTSQHKPVPSSVASELSEDSMIAQQSSHPEQGPDKADTTQALASVATENPTPNDQQPPAKPGLVADSSPSSDAEPEQNRPPTTKMESDKNVQAQPATSTGQTEKSASARVGNKKAAAITEHLASAEADLAAFRLTTPPENNAYLHFQAVLNMEPDNEKALAGLQGIINVYVRLIDKAIQEDHRNWAQIYLQRAEAILPESPELLRIREELIIDEKNN